MKLFWKRYVKNQRGLTLIELLAVIVIIGIIAAIAIPAIGNIIDNSKKDAHLANARMLVDAARLYITSHGDASGDNVLTLKELKEDGLLTDIKVPGSDDVYDEDDTQVAVGGSAPNYSYSVTLSDGEFEFIEDLDPNDSGTDRKDVKLYEDEDDED